MNTWKAGLAFGLLSGGIVGSTTPVCAQGATFPDVPSNHWAYQAVGDLAEKGYVKGYPDGKFLGKRALTRYEFATVIDRMAQTITDLSAQAKAGQAVATPTGAPVTQDDLNKIQALTDSFRRQLADIQSVTAGAASPFQDQLDAVRADLLDIQSNVAKAQAAADGSYGFGATRKFQITGYIQARYQESGKAKTLYPQGGNAAISGAYNGNYATQGANNESFQVRRSRLKFTGGVTPNTKFGIQIDASGAITAGTAGSNQQVTVREGYVAYTPGSGDPALYPTVTAGLFANPFGYELPASAATILTPERPLAFSEASYGIFNSQDYDKGVQLSYNTPQQLIGFLPGGLKLTAALVNGTGRTSEDVDRHVDQVYRVAYTLPSKIANVGVSYYNGQLGAADTPVSTTNFGRSKQLFGADAQVTLPFGVFVNGEYLKGKYEQRTYFTNETTLVTNYAPGNHIEGYYLQGGYTFGPLTNNPLSLFVSYDVLRRSEGGINSLTAASLAAVGGQSGSSFNDENVGYGASLNLDKQTRLRVYYQVPTSVAHQNTFDPQKIRSTTAELQVRF